MGLIQEKAMAVKKEPIEINCSECRTSFRLWVPSELLSEWDKGARISCVRCGAPYLIKKGKKGYDLSLLTLAGKDAHAEPATVPSPEPFPAPAPRPEAPTAAEPEISAAPVEAADERSVVLLIDDDKLAREMVAKTLEGTDFKLIAVKNAVEAIKVLRKERVSLVVSDLYLKNPGDPDSTLDGEDLLRRIVSSGMNIPAIVTTGKDIIDDMVLDPKWFDLRVKGFIQKGNPFWADELKLKIKEVLYKD